MGLNWLSALALLSGITPKLLVFGEGKRRGLICAMALSEVIFFTSKRTDVHMTHYTSSNSATGTFFVWSMCGTETLWRCGLQWRNCLCLKTSYQRDCFGWILWSWLFTHAEHICSLQEEAHWVVEYNGCTYNRSVGCWVLCCHRSTSSISTNQADESHLDWFSACTDAHWLTPTLSHNVEAVPYCCFYI